MTIIMIEPCCSGGSNQAELSCLILQVVMLHASWFVGIIKLAKDDEAFIVPDHGSVVEKLH